MKHLLSLIFISSILMSCEQRFQPNKPDNLIPQEKMTNVLYDMFIASSAKGVSRIKFEAKGIDPETYILKKYEIDSLQFALSNDYYAHNVELYNAMIEDVKAKLTAEKTKFEAIEKDEKEKNKRKKDSLKQLLETQKKDPKYKNSPSRVKQND
ncbi:MAG: DUF4296 domain-containing protein [Winogradskyella sp.]|uniref:DUF4296 domain-containing protein n=1 Tax=Winogradskyella sp. TaxID=1883156 RepID=UPI000F3F0108|nr:DUF4296 domain-containing protein [Winogradskyella sp.]RNC87785.1 MAG: DUF4296 domain-containing protein [Winogradskyella sp.]